MDFMEHRVRLHSKRLLISVILLGGIGACQQIQPQSPLVVLATDARFQQRNGLIYLQDSLFSGEVIAFYPHTKDSLYRHGFLSGKEHGLWKEYYPGNRLMESRYFERGSKEGNYLAYWENGVVRLNYHFLHDEYEGICEEWNEQGRLIRRMHYQRGREEGMQQQFYDDGSIRSNYLIKDGRRFGLLGTKNCVNVSDTLFQHP